VIAPPIKLVWNKLAFRALFWLNSYSSPEKFFLPLFDCWLIVEPACRPIDAS
jgi:hypothetical protein